MLVSRTTGRVLIAGETVQRFCDEARDVGLGEAKFVGAATPVLLEPIEPAQREESRHGLARDLVGRLAWPPTPPPMPARRDSSVNVTVLVLCIEVYVTRQRTSLTPAISPRII